jgi:hypothetical protein
MGKPIKVNILNHGKLFGITTPAYGVTLDSEAVSFLKELGMRIEPYVPPVQKPAEKPEEKENKPKQHVEIQEVLENGVLIMKPVVVSDEPVVPEAEKAEVNIAVDNPEPVKDIDVDIELVDDKKPAESGDEKEYPTLESLDPQEMNPLYYIKEAPEKCTKEVYTAEDLKDFTRKELLTVLNYRGHYSSRTGARDALAAKFHDNKDTIINKILKTNPVK